MNTAQVIDFNSIWCSRKAAGFVEVYVTSGKVAASKWSKENIPRNRVDELNPYVREEFSKRGIKI